MAAESKAEFRRLLHSVDQEILRFAFNDASDSEQPEGEAMITDEKLNKMVAASGQDKRHGATVRALVSEVRRLRKRSLSDIEARMLIANMKADGVLPGEINLHERLRAMVKR